MLRRFWRARSRKVLVVGLDCAEPSLVFDRWRNDLPTLRRLMDGGAYGPLTSSTPCITVPAWSAMTSSKDPGVLGIYGFRNRADRGYHSWRIASSSAVREPRVWELLGAAGKQVVVVGVPQTYPVQPVNGWLVSGLLTPSVQRPYTHPPDLRHDIDRWLGGATYDVDVPHFRTGDKEALLTRIYAMTEKRFTVLRHLLREKPWDFAMFVEMGVDRMHHAFWKYMDPAHVRHVPGNPYQDAIKTYYQYIDTQLGILLESADDDTVVLVVSDHGAKKLDGGFCINEWLREAGYLVLKDNVPVGETPVSLEKAEVDWEKTVAWSTGGYYARLFLNVKGREPQGRIAASDYERVRTELADALTAAPGPSEQPLSTTCFRPEALYRTVRGIAPDLLAYLGDLRWRAIGTLGHGGTFTPQNDTGPDDANHAQDGLLIYHDPKRNLCGQRLDGLELMDVAPTILRLMKQPIPPDMQGHVLPVAGS